MIRSVFLSILLALSFSLQAKTLLVKVDYDQDGYHINQLQVLDRAFAAMSGRPVQQNAIRYQFFDAQGVVLQQGFVSDPSVVAAEFHGAPLSGNQGQIAHKVAGSFVIRIPYTESMVSLTLSRMEATEDRNRKSDLSYSQSKGSQPEFKPVLIEQFNLTTYPNFSQH